MNVDEMYSAINKGIPNQIKLELPIQELINYCQENVLNIDDAISRIRNNYENIIVSFSGYNKSNHEFFDSLRLITNYKNSLTQIYVSPNCFINRIKEILGVNNDSLDLNNMELMNEFNNRLNKLNSINDIDDLREQFPIIFEDFKYGLNLMDEIKKEEKNNPIMSDYMRANYQKYGLDSRFKVFLSNQKLMYANFVKYAKDIIEYTNSNPINFDYFNGLDKDKFELYLAYKYLEYAKNTQDDKSKQASIYYLTSYLNESCGKLISMTYKNHKISNASLLKDFRKFLKDNHELKPIDESRNVYESYHIKHVKNHINKYLNSLENWCVIRVTPNEILQKQQARLEKLADYNIMHQDLFRRDIKHRLLEKYIAMLMRKLNFYESTNYSLRLFGLGPFESHVAYFYPNGLVLVDKLYDESLDINPTFNEAIYVMNVETFLNMITMDKPDLRENSNVKRVIHSGSWEERLKQEIEKPSIRLNQEDASTLINKYQKIKSKY